MVKTDILINLDDYTDFNYEDIFSTCAYFTAKDKRTGKLVHVNIYNTHLDVTKCLNIDLYQYSIASTINHPGIIKVIGFRYPLNEKEKQKTKIHSIKCEYKNKYCDFDVTGFVVILESTKKLKVDTCISEYLKSHNTSIINPTIRSKIIFGVASTMKYLHKKGFVHLHLSLSDIFFG